MSRTIRACLSLFRIRVVESFQYRIAAFSGTVTSLIWVLVEAVAFTVFFKYADAAGFAGGLTLEQTMSYIWVREMLLFMQPYSIDNELRTKINNGDVGLDMCRPIDLYWHWFARSSAGKIVSFVMRSLTCFAIGFLIPGGYGARLPASAVALLMFILSFLLAFMLAAAYGMLAAAIRVNVAWGDGPMFFMMLTGQVLSGGHLPLQLWPDFMQKFLLFQPFAGLCDIPARLYIGSMSVSEAWFGMGVQLCWTVIFIALGRIVMAHRLRRIVAQGG